MNLGGLFDLEEKQNKVKQLEKKMAAENFWSNQAEAQKVIDESNQIKGLIDGFMSLEEQFEDVDVTYELVVEEEDQELYVELTQEVDELLEEINKFEIEMLLSGPYDSKIGRASSREGEECGTGYG